MSLKYASVCDGIGAAHVAWQPLGWQCQWTSEIEPFPAAVVEHHYGFRNLGDMAAITEEMLDAPVNLLVGGTPCQSFSVAGLRGGLDDPRGNLALRFVQLAAVMQPRWIVWENVPGVLSSGKGRDFGTLLGALGELGYGFAYRVLDAQWFGVAQRRRRVFVVGRLGDWRRAAAVLFERESVFGNPPTRGKAGQGAAVASSIRTKTGRSDDRGDGCDQANSEHCQGHAGTLNCDKGQQGGIIAFTKSKRAQSTTDDETWVPGEVSPTMSCFDQGDTRATTVVAFSERTRDYGSHLELEPTDVCPAIKTGSNRQQGVLQPMAVRRLTPRECERLQGFPDDYTLVTYRNKPAADGQRYRALGNSMAVPVMRWIGERIAMVETL